MMEDITTFISRNWASRECPIFDGIVFGDGSRVPIAFERDFLADGTCVRLEVLPREWNSAWVLEDDTFWSALTSRCEIVLKDGSYAECGEGSFGGDGYVALSRQNRELCWVLFLEDANPFISLDVRGNHLVAINSHAEIWDVPIENPENLRVASSIRDEHAV